MSSSPVIDASVREKIISAPESILDDQDVMRALIAANERIMGGNIVDLRGIAMDRLESRLDRLEDTHRSVIAAAYENLAGTNQVHRAILRMLDAGDFEGFLRDLNGPVSDILQVDRIALVLETPDGENDPSVEKLRRALAVTGPDFINEYLLNGRSGQPRAVTLRQIQAPSERIYGDAAEWIRSEACLRLDFGTGRLPGMLALGAEDPDHFSPQQGTDLLGFFAGVFERSMRHWLS